MYSLSCYYLVPYFCIPLSCGSCHTGQCSWSRTVNFLSESPIPAQHRSRGATVSNSLSAIAEDLGRRRCPFLSSFQPIRNPLMQHTFCMTTPCSYYSCSGPFPALQFSLARILRLTAELSCNSKRFRRLSYTLWIYLERFSLFFVLFMSRIFKNGRSVIPSTCVN